MDLSAILAERRRRKAEEDEREAEEQAKRVAEWKPTINLDDYYRSEQDAPRG